MEYTYHETRLRETLAAAEAARDCCARASHLGLATLHWRKLQPVDAHRVNPALFMLPQSSVRATLLANDGLLRASHHTASRGVRVPVPNAGD